MIKAIITGSSGMVGQGALLECLDSSDVSDVLVINRRPINIKHPKLKELLVDDFFDLSSIEKELSGYNACFFCLGTSAAGMSEEKYQHITYDLTLHFAETILKHNPGLTFCYVSGTGTDSQENSRMMWARVKGKTENDLLKLPFKAAFMFRPGYIQPLRGIKTKTKVYQIFYALLKPLYPILKHFPKFVTDTTKVGQAMIHVALSGYEKPHLESVDINFLK
ncbi:MAG: epimerase [Candidatus Marinimicrobia bacterium]|nr:epimerase [Candidatus Neomarinimicrobiota bacterium]